jgi:hypothetical protein
MKKVLCAEFKNTVILFWVLVLCIWFQFIQRIEQLWPKNLEISHASQILANDRQILVLS